MDGADGGAEIIGISVVIPTHNRAEMLAKCLAALADQKPPAVRVEVIVVDDGSTDGTSAFVTSMAPAFPYPLRVVRKPNGGASSARNAGVREARGDVVAFLDDDCVPREDWLERLTELLERHPEAAGIGGLIEPVETKSRISRYIVARNLLTGPTTHNGRVAVVLTANAAFRRRDLEAVGGFDESFPFAGGEDVDLSRRLLESGRTLVCGDRMVVRHHHRTRFGTFARTYYWYGFGSGVSHAKRNGPVSRAKALARRTWSVAYLLAAPLYCVRHLVSGIGLLDAALYGALDGARKAAYAAGRASGLRTAPRAGPELVARSAGSGS